MVFAVAIDSDVRVNTNRWHFSGTEPRIRCSNCIDQYCKTYTVRNVDISHLLLRLAICISVSTFTKLFERQNEDICEFQIYNMKAKIVFVDTILQIYSNFRLLRNNVLSIEIIFIVIFKKSHRYDSQ